MNYEDEENVVTFSHKLSVPEGVLRICTDGRIYWSGRLVTTHKELADGLRDVVAKFRPLEVK